MTKTWSKLTIHIKNLNIAVIHENKKAKKRNAGC